MQFKNLQLKRAMRAALLVLLLSVVGIINLMAQVYNDDPYCVGDTIHLFAPPYPGAIYSWIGPNNYRSRYQNPARRNCTMEMAGPYTVTVTHFDDPENPSVVFSDSYTTEVIIYPKPVASFTATACTGTATQFDASNSTTDPPGYSIASYEWDFGDGNTGSGVNISHVYGQPGTYQVKLSVAYNSYCTDEITRYVTVSENISFADANVKALCVTHWDTNRDGELSFDEAAAVTTLGGVFTDKTNITSFDELTFFTGLTSIGYAAFYNCTALTSVEIPNSVTTIGNYAFSGCSGFTGSLIIPNSVTSIGGSAFSGCSGFTGSLTIGNTVTSIGSSAFSGCTFNGLNVDVISIPSSAFSGCSGFTGSLTIPSSVTSIGNYAFSDCSGFTELHYNTTNVVGGSSIFFGCNFLMCIIGENVESLPNNMFYYSLLSIIKSNAIVPPTVSASTFTGISRDLPVIVPCGSLEAYQEAAYWSEFTNIRESEYSLAVKANPNHLGSAIIVQEPDCNNSYASVRAEPKPGCHFINWTCNGIEVSRDRHYSFNMEEDMVLTANFETHKRFVHTVSAFWSNPNNWEPAGVPTDTMSVDLKSAVTIDTDVTVGSVFNNDNHVMTIMSGATLTVIDKLESSRVSNVIIEDGGQLIHSDDGVYATVKKTITSYTQGEHDGWCLITSPLANDMNVSEEQHLMIGEYDLYYYDESTMYWINHENDEESYDVLENGMGYLYSNNCYIPSFEPQIGFGNGTIGYFPFYTYYDNSISETLFLAEELENSGVINTPMTSLSWYATNSTGYLQSNISIWMANVNASALTTTSHKTTDMTLVYTGAMTPEIGWNEFVFNEDDFAWDGASNLLVCVQRNNGAYNNSIYWQSHNCGFVGMSYLYRDNTPYDVINETYSMYTSTSRPNTIFKTLGQEGEHIVISFKGQLQNGTAPVNIPLSYTEGIDHPGYNLVGNPYVHNVTSYASENVAEGCYRLNETQDEIIVSDISEANPLKVAEGFFVKATSENASITFNPQAKGKASHGGSIRLEITENGQLVDRLIVKEEGKPLEKLSLKKGSTKLFATEGQREMALVPIKGNEQAISFKAAHDGMYTLKVNVDGMVVEHLHLIDNLTGEDINLLDTSTGSVSDYTFEAKTTDDAHRFKLVFSISGDADIDKNK